MSTELTIAVLCGIAGMLCWGLADFFAKTAVETVHEVTALLVSQATGVPLLAILLVVHGGRVDVSAGELPALVALGATDAIGLLLLYRGFSRGDVSILSPIFAAYAAPGAMLSWLAFDEAMPLTRAIAIGVVVIGLVLIGIDPAALVRRGASARTTGGLPEVVAGMLVYAGWFVIFDRLVSDRDWIAITLVIRIATVLTTLAYARWRGISIAMPAGPAERRAVVLIGLGDVAATSVVSIGYSTTTYTSVVLVVSSAFSLPTMVLAFLFLKERMTRLQIAAAVLILGGVGLVSLP